jgi:PAS domain S-box-containing protein
MGGQISQVSCSDQEYWVLSASFFSTLQQVQQRRLMRLLPYLVLLLALAVTWWRYQEALVLVRSDRGAHFEDAARELVDKIEQRGQRYERVLRGVSGLYPYLVDSTDDLAFSKYVDTLDISKEYPGVNGMGMVWIVSPPVDATKVTLVLRIAPDSAHNLSLLGYDPWSDPRRRIAMDRSLQMNQPILSDHLAGPMLAPNAQELPEFEMYMPVFGFSPIRKLKLPGRHSNYVGWAFFTLDVGNFVKSAVESTEVGVGLDIYDGYVATSGQALMYSSDSGAEDHQIGPHLFETTKRIKIGGHGWTVKVHSTPQFEASLDFASANRILRMGALLGLFLFVILWLLVNAQKQARRIADSMTRDLQKLGRAIEQSPAATMITDTQGRIEFASSRLYEISGYTAQELMGQSPSILSSGLTPKRIYDDLWATIKAGKVWKGTLQNRKKDGTIYWASQIISGITNERGDLVSFISAKEDITVQKMAQQELANSQAFNLAIMDSIVEGLVVIDRAGLIMAVNQPWRNMNFQNAAEPSKPAASTDVGSNFLALCQVGVNFSFDEEALQAREGIKAVLDGRLSHFNLEFASHQLSQLRWLSMSASPMGPDGRGAVIAHADITERKKNETAAITYQDDLEAMVVKRTAELRALAMELLQTETRERQAVAADLHDDLGQILAVAKLKLSALTVPGSGMDASHFLRQMKDIENMIDRSSVSVRSLSTQLSPPTLSRHGLNAALEWLAEEMMRTYGLLVKLDLGELALLDEAVSSALFRMVRELLINVWKHGQVHYAKVTMNMDPDSHKLTIRVADAGVGFEVPQMLKSTTKHSYGLFSISERLALIGGTLHIDSHVGGGTTVTMLVPSVKLLAEFEGAER